MKQTFSFSPKIRRFSVDFAFFLVICTRKLPKKSSFIQIFKVQIAQNFFDSKFPWFPQTLSFSTQIRNYSSKFEFFDQNFWFKSRNFSITFVFFLNAWIHKLPKKPSFTQIHQVNRAQEFFPTQQSNLAPNAPRTASLRTKRRRKTRNNKINIQQTNNQQKKNSFLMILGRFFS